MRLKFSEANNQLRACMRCTWWEPFNSAAGHCKRMPPVRPDDDAEGAWPMTGRADWCGEYLELYMGTSAGPTPRTDAEVEAAIHGIKQGGRQ